MALAEQRRAPVAAGCVRSFLAPNPGPLAFDGTRSYVVGAAPRAAVIDPGPDDDAHLAALAGAVAGVPEVVVLLTHAHPDHAGGAATLSDALGGCRVAGPGGRVSLEDGERIETSAGVLAAVSTPGHAKRHFCFRLPSAGAVFSGDLILGEGDTTWVGEHPGAVADYLASLDRVEALAPRILYPGHGPPVRRPSEAVARFRQHRLERIEQVRVALAAGVDPAPEALAAHVYGRLSPELFAMACKTVASVLDYISADPPASG